MSQPLASQDRVDLVRRHTLEVTVWVDEASYWGWSIRLRGQSVAQSMPPDLCPSPQTALEAGLKRLRELLDTRAAAAARDRELAGMGR